MDHQRDSWHLTKEQIDKLEHMSCWRLDLILLRAYWMKYHKIVGIVTMVALCFILRPVVCGSFSVSVFGCKPAPLAYVLTITIVSMGLYILSISIVNRIGIYNKMGGVKPYILTIIVTHIIAPSLNNVMYSIAIMLLFPAMGILFYYGLHQLGRLTMKPAG